MIPIRLILEIAGGFVLVGLIVFVLAHERHVGEAEVKTQDNTAVANQTKLDDAKVQAEAGAVQQEAKTYASETHTLIVGAPVISMCVDPPRPVHSAAEAEAGPSVDGNADSGTGRARVPTIIEWDSRPVVQRAHDADAQIAGLQDYIRRVCEVP